MRSAGVTPRQAEPRPEAQQFRPHRVHDVPPELLEDVSLSPSRVHGMKGPRKLTWHNYMPI